MPIPGAQILPIEENGRLGRWQTTDDQGRLAGERDPGRYRFRVQASGYLNTPRTGVAFPTIAIIESQTSTASVELEPDPAAPAPAQRGAIAGVVQGSAESLLVVAEEVQGARATYTDADGAFTLLGARQGTNAVRVWGAGWTPASQSGVQVQAGETVADLQLEVSAAEGVSVQGQLTEGSRTTRVVLVEPQSQTEIPGLEVQAMFGSAYEITGVPDGRFQVRAGLETDGRVLNAQQTLESGEPIADVAGAAVTVDLATQPAVEGLQANPGGELILSWTAQPETEFYVVELFDAVGQSLWGGFDVSGNPRFRVLAPDTQVPYDGPALTSGALHRFRVYAAIRDPLVPSRFELIGASEPLEGWFRAGL